MSQQPGSDKKRTKAPRHGRTVGNATVQPASSTNSGSTAGHELNNEEREINMRILKKADPLIGTIEESAAQVALYEYDKNSGEYKKMDVEGPLFVVSRDVKGAGDNAENCPLGNSRYATVIMNRMTVQNTLEPLAHDCDVKLNDHFLLYKSRTNILCIWFFDKNDAQRINNKMLALIAELKTSSQATPKKVDIMSLLTNGSTPGRNNANNATPVRVRTPTNTAGDKLANTPLSTDTRQRTFSNNSRLIPVNDLFKASGNNVKEEPQEQMSGGLVDMTKIGAALPTQSNDMNGSKPSSSTPLSTPLTTKGKLALIGGSGKIKPIDFAVNHTVPTAAVAKPIASTATVSQQKVAIAAQPQQQQTHVPDQQQQQQAAAVSQAQAQPLQLVTPHQQHQQSIQSPQPFVNHIAHAAHMHAQAQAHAAHAQAQAAHAQAQAQAHAAALQQIPRPPFAVPLAFSPHSRMNGGHPQQPPPAHMVLPHAPPHPHHPAHHYPPQLSMEQLKQSLVWMLQNDADFLHALHRVYVERVRGQGPPQPPAPQSMVHPPNHPSMQ